jgi:hypothetical protein
MDIPALIVGLFLIMWSASIIYVQYQIHCMMGTLREASKVCEDAVNSLRNGGV